jgi:hypothetical protein
MRLNEVAGTASRPFPGESCSTILSQLSEKCEKAEQERDLLHEEIRKLGAVAQDLGGRTASVPSPLSLPEAERLVTAARETVNTLFNEAWKRLENGLSDMGLNPEVIPRNGATPDEVSSALASAQDWFEQVKNRVNALREMGVEIPEITDKEGILDQLDEAVRCGKEELRQVNDCLQALGPRLVQIGGSSDSHVGYPVVRLDNANAALAALRVEIHRLTRLRLDKASEDANRAYKALVSSSGYDEEYKPLCELRDLGLIHTAEDGL